MFLTLKFLQMKIRHPCSFFTNYLAIIYELKAYEHNDFTVDELTIDINFYPAYAASVWIQKFTITWN